MGEVGIATCAAGVTMGGRGQVLLGEPGKAPRAGIQVSPQQSRGSWAKGQGLQAGGAACRKAPNEAVQPT